MNERAKRIHQKENAAKKQKEIADIHSVTVKSTKHATTSALTCGRSDCWLCGNPRKFRGEKTIQEQRFEQNLD